ncbi:hypothetical protein [Helicobacter trogontum]|uniref:hypothetical protein n=1 Tax=Helicobacter trogontum TaxID=50960 RepID=UPI00188463EF|nr:hypothetical protein [Helicobacter trogontum]
MVSKLDCPPPPPTFLSFISHYHYIFTYAYGVCLKFIGLQIIAFLVLNNTKLLTF